MRTLHLYFDSMSLVYLEKKDGLLITYVMKETYLRHREEDMKTGHILLDQARTIDVENPEVGMNPLQVWLYRGFRGIPQDLRGTE